MKKIMFLIILLYVMIPIKLLSFDFNTIEGIEKLKKDIDKLTLEIEKIEDDSQNIKKRYLDITREYKKITIKFLNQKTSCINLQSIYRKQQKEKKLSKRVIDYQNEMVLECYKYLNILEDNYEQNIVEFQELKKRIDKLNNLNMTYSIIAKNKIKTYLKAYSLFSLKGENGSLDVDSINKSTGKIKDVYCKDEIIKIQVKNLNKYYIIALTIDENGKVIILKSNRNFIETQVMPPYGLDRIKIFAFENKSIYNKTLKYQNNNLGILSSTDIDILYELLKKEKSLKDKWFMIKTKENCTEPE